MANPKIEHSNNFAIESVWEYPRPPRLEPTQRRLRVIHAGTLIAETQRGLRILETSHPPVYYIPPADIRMELLEARAGRSSFCEFKGYARYWNLALDGHARISDAAWSYPDPAASYAALKDHLAFYASRVDQCWVDEERVSPQPGDFYGGWITPHVTGPFKGAPGTLGW